MKAEKLYNVLEGFDFRLLDNPEFQEDSVREEIVLPIIKGLGYSANKPNQIIRSRKLLHPFVSIGSKRKDIYIIPDYLMEVSGTPVWILDAKSPGEIIIKSHNVEQAYSYAIHSEVRVSYYALCNGKEFVLYNIHETQPVLHFPINAMPRYWESLKKFLSPETVLSNEHSKLAKDLGLHLKRLGFDSLENLFFSNVPISEIGQLDPDMFTFSSGVDLDGTNYVVSFDFGYEVLEQLIGKIPSEAIRMVLNRSENQRQVVRFGDRIYKISLDCKIGAALQENQKEIFLPLIINRIID